MARTSWVFAHRYLVAACVSLGLAADVAAQTARVAREENFRSQPNGTVLGRLGAGTPLRVVARDGNWLQVDLDGWVWLASLQVSSGEADLVVSADGGENLRSEPQGTVLGRFEEGVLLEELGRRPGWANVRRRGWIWSASVEETTASGPPPGGASAAAPAARPDAGAGMGATARPEGFTTIGAAGAPVLAAPDGDTLALASPGTDVEVVSRQGNWARVRIDGWVWLPAAEEPSAPAGASAAPATLRPEDLTASPDAHVGRVVAWELQFISRERAEAIRTDFRQGEPFLLTRFGGPDGPFVYVAVPPERLAEVQGLVPLERITVTARVRTGAAELTGAPILDLLSIESLR